MIPQDLKKSAKGGRPSNHSLLLTQAEYEWLAKSVSKRVTRITAESSPKIRAAIQSVDEKLTVPVPATPPNEGLVVKLTRDELQVINLLVGNTVKGLRDTVIPEYAKRAPSSPRLVEAMQTALMLSELHNKGTRIYAAGSHRRGNGRVP